MEAAPTHEARLDDGWIVTIQPSSGSANVQAQDELGREHRAAEQCRGGRRAETSAHMFAFMWAGTLHYNM